MKKYRHNFTLTEVLTVIAIIGILASITTPIVIMSRDRGRVAQAQGDITAIVTALKQMYADYGKVLKKNGQKYYIADKKVSFLPGNDTRDKDIVRIPKDVDIEILEEEDRASIKDHDYNALMLELSAPSIKQNTSNKFPVSVNKRRRIYLDPRKEFDPSMKYEDFDDPNEDGESALAQKESIYRDPWGLPYIVYIKVTYDDQLNITKTSKTISGNFAVYSFGPNGENDYGCNADLEDCIKDGDHSNHRKHDDVASWNI